MQLELELRETGVATPQTPPLDLPLMLETCVIHVQMMQADSKRMMLTMELEIHLILFTILQHIQKNKKTRTLLLQSWRNCWKYYTTVNSGEARNFEELSRDNLERC